MQFFVLCLIILKMTFVKVDECILQDIINFLTFCELYVLVMISKIRKMILIKISCRFEFFQTQGPGNLL